MDLLNPENGVLIYFIPFLGIVFLPAFAKAGTCLERPYLG